MNTIRIVAAIASQHGITIYQQNGEQTNLPNDTWKTKAILDKVLPTIGKGQVAEIDLDSYSVEKVIEDKTAGVIRFIEKTMAQLQDMLADLKGSTVSYSGTVEAPPMKELVAVVKTPKGDVEIPGVSALEKHMDHAVFTGNTKGLQRFMERIAEVIKDRGHTVQELLNFMKRGDLPIADDGSIVAYKVLQSSGDHFVDCHTKKVKQKLGSRVFMAPKLVDPSKRTQCSSGLHIARRGYLANFPGDIITLVKVAPEDVVAVPDNEPDKMRAAAYHIVAVLPPEVHKILRSNQPMTENSVAAKMLADVIAGNHVKVLEQVRIGAAAGENVESKATEAINAPKPKTGRNGEAKAIDDGTKGLTPKEIREMARKAKEEERSKLAALIETKAERDARKKREKRAMEKAAKEKAANPVPSEEARFHTFGSSKAVENILDKPAAPTETKAERDARKKREKRAAEREAKYVKAVDKAIGAKANVVIVDEIGHIDRVIPGETKAKRDARRKREKRALANGSKGQA